MTSQLRVQHVPRHRRAGLPRSAPAGRSGLLRASALMAAGSIISRMLGFVRTFLFGAILAGSASSAANAFSAANTLPSTVWILVGGGTLNAILVPAIVRAITRPDRGRDYISKLMTLVATASLAITALCMVAVPLLIILTSGVLPAETFALAVQLGLWMMPQIFFSALYVMCGQLLNAHNSFGPYQWAPVLNNLVAIVGAGIFLGLWGTVGDPSQWTPVMVMAMAAINVGGSAAQVLFLFIFVRMLGLRLRPAWGLRGLGLGKLSRMGLWTLGVLALGQVGVWATRWATGGAVRMAEQLRDQPQEAAHYPALLSIEWAYLAFMLPQGIIAVSVVTAVFPSISRHAADGEHSKALAGYAQTNRLLAAPMVLCTAVFIALAGPIMWVIGGGTGRTAAEANSWVLVGYMLGLVPFAALYLVKRVFYAYEDARTPFILQIPNTAVGVVAMPIILAVVDPRWAAATAATVSSMGNLLAWVTGLWILNRRATSLGANRTSSRTTVVVLMKLIGAGILSWAVGAGLIRLIGDAFWHHRMVAVVLGVLVATVMTVVFIAVGWLARVDELQDMMRTIRRRLGRTRPARSDTLRSAS